LEEAQERALGSTALQQKYISVGGGPAALPPIYHTVIDLPKELVKNYYATALYVICSNMLFSCNVYALV